MKVSKAQTTENRDAILRAAAGQIRARGYDQMSMADVARASNLTHGAVYNHFRSKEALQAEATRYAFEDTAGAFMGLPIDAFLKRYLSPQHRDNPVSGCPNAALVSEVARQPAEIREAFRDGLLRFLAMSEEKLAAAGINQAREAAVAMFAAMVGGLALSRAVRGVDDAAAEEILQAVSNQLENFAHGRSKPSRRKGTMAPQTKRSPADS